ncbi:MAG: hypothetical protein MI975_22610, partial [Cytophagales bacterium]|nr:hypothetical protein [Cytophagales bacterium]
MREGYYDKSFNIILLIVDLLGLTIVFYVSYFLRFNLNSEITIEFYMFLLLVAILWIVTSFYNKIYLLSKLRSLVRAFTNLL